MKSKTTLELFHDYYDNYSTDEVLIKEQNKRWVAAEDVEKMRVELIKFAKKSWGRCQCRKNSTLSCMFHYVANKINEVMRMKND